MISANKKTAPAIDVNISNIALLETRGLINGEWRTAKDNKTFPVYEPSSGQVLRECSDFDVDDFLAAIDSAEAGFRQYSTSTTAKERGLLLRRWYEKIVHNVEDCEYTSTADGP